MIAWTFYRDLVEVGSGFTDTDHTPFISCSDLEKDFYVSLMGQKAYFWPATSFHHLSAPCWYWVDSFSRWSWVTPWFQATMSDSFSSILKVVCRINNPLGASLTQIMNWYSIVWSFVIVHTVMLVLRLQTDDYIVNSAFINRIFERICSMIGWQWKLLISLGLLNELWLLISMQKWHTIRHFYKRFV